jgi:hypothetical protein
LIRFKRFLAIILMLILPLQSTLAAIDGCCNGSVQEQAAEGRATAAPSTDQASSQDADAANCCVLCDLCNHSSVSFVATMNAPQTYVPTAAPLPHPESPFDSFIPDVPARPDRA